MPKVKVWNNQDLKSRTVKEGSSSSSFLNIRGISHFQPLTCMCLRATLFQCFLLSSLFLLNLHLCGRPIKKAELNLVSSSDFFLFLIYILALKRFLKVWLYIFLGQRCLTITSNLWPGFSRMLYKKITVGFLFVCFLWVYFCFPFLMIGFQSTDLIRVFSFGRLFVLP